MTRERSKECVHVFRMEGEGGGKGIMQSGAVYATILATPTWDPSTHIRALRGRRDSFGPSDKSHMCEYDVPIMSSAVSVIPRLTFAHRGLSIRIIYRYAVFASGAPARSSTYANIHTKGSTWINVDM